MLQNPAPIMQADVSASAIEVPASVPVECTCTATRGPVKITAGANRNIEISLFDPAGIDAIFIGTGQVDFNIDAGRWRAIDYPFSDRAIISLLNSVELTLASGGHGAFKRTLRYQIEFAMAAFFVGCNNCRTRIVNYTLLKC